MAASDYVPISFKNRLHLAGRPQMSTPPSPLLLCAAFHKILPLWADDLLIDCLFEAVKVSLCHAKLHLISLLLASHSL